MAANPICPKCKREMPKLEPTGKVEATRWYCTWCRIIARKVQIVWDDGMSEAPDFFYEYPEE